jgi:hypothetical protein
MECYKRYRTIDASQGSSKRTRSLKITVSRSSSLADAASCLLRACSAHFPVVLEKAPFCMLRATIGVKGSLRTAARAACPSLSSANLVLLVARNPSTSFQGIFDSHQFSICFYCVFHVHILFKLLWRLTCFCERSVLFLSPSPCLPFSCSFDPSGRNFSTSLRLFDDPKSTVTSVPPVVDGPVPNAIGVENVVQYLFLAPEAS